ncbi:hypothetical protein ATE62_05595 [Sphingopyxis sp. HIX]|nr:hypothetical protein ATE62_05595 [Sphingopyxis sp. HIX]
MPAACSSPISRTRRAGDPAQSSRSGISLFSVSKAPAASIASLPMVQPFMTVALSPTNARSASVQPWTIARWPISTSSPMIVGKPSGRCGIGPSQWTTLPSWMFDLAPTTIWLTSARSTQLYQMLTSGPMRTSPMIRQPGAMKALGSICGVLPLTVMMLMSLIRRDLR